MKRILSAILVLCLAAAWIPALAGTIELNGNVVSGVTQSVLSSYGGTVGQVLVREGQKVKAGDVLAVLETTKVYAKESGTVYLFGSVGDDAADTAEIYGSVVSLEPDTAYTVTGSTKYAYDSESNRTIHPGEAVTLATMDGISSGRGIVTAVADSSFEVLVTVPGTLSAGDTAYIYRTGGDSTVGRIGRGTVTRRGPFTYTGEGIITGFAVSSGQKVVKGALLFETVSGTYRGETGDLTLIKAPADGVIASVYVAPGTTLNAGAEVAEIYPTDSLRIEAVASESDLAGIRAGDRVQVELIYADNGGKLLAGQVEYISSLGIVSASEDSEEATYAVYVAFQGAAPADVFYGMSAIVTPLGQEEITDAWTEPAEEETGTAEE